MLAERLATIRRSDGSRQATYAGKPLYYYVGDRKPRQILCQNVSEFGGLWLVVRPNGTVGRHLLSTPPSAMPGLEAPLQMENPTEAVNRRAPTHAAYRSRHLLALLSMLCLFVVG